MAVREEVIISVSIDKQQAQKDAAQLTKEISGLTARRKVLNNELTALTQNERELTNERGKAQQALLALEAAGKQNTDQALALRVEIGKINDAYNQNARVSDRVASELVSVNTTITQNRRELRVLNRELEVNEGSLNEQRAALSRLNRTYDNFRVGVDGSKQDLKELGQEIAELTNKIKKQEESTGRFQRNVGNYANSITEALGSAIPGANGLTAALATGPGIVAGIAAGIGAGVAKLGQFQQQLEAKRKEIELLTGATGDTLDNLTAAIDATASINNVQFNEVLIAANAATEQMGGSLQENIELIQKGFASGANISGEFLDNLREYPTHFQAAGLGLEEMIAISTQNVKSGIFSDKGVDTIKEATIRIREMPKATKLAFDAIGLSGDQIAEQLAKGETTIFEVIQKVSGRLDELPPQSKVVGQAIADIFGGPGEDAGLEYIKTLKDIDLNLDNVLKESGEFAVQQLRLTQANQELNLVFNQLLGSADGFFTEAKIGATELLTQGIRGLINGVIQLSNYFIDFYNNFIPLRVAFQFFIANVRTVVDVVQNSFGAMVDSVRTFGRLFKAVFTLNFKEIPKIISEEFKNARQRGKDFGKDLAENYVDGYNNVFETVDLIEPLKPSDGEFDGLNNDFYNAGKDAADSFDAGFGKLDLGAALDDILGNLDPDAIEFEVEGMRLDTESRIGDINKEIANENLLYAQQRAKGIADETVHQERLLKLRREKLGLEAALLEDGSAEKIAKLTELAEVEAEIFEGKEKRKTDFEKEMLDKREENRQKAEQQRAASEAAQRQKEDAIIGAATEFTNTMIQLTRTRTDEERAQQQERIDAFFEASTAYKVAVLAQKAVAAIEIGINLQREIQAYWATSATAGPAAPAIAIPLTIAAIARSAAALANIARFEEGGQLSDGTSGMAIGPSHADGGIYATVAKRSIINFEGGEYIVNASAAQNNLPALQAINAIGDKVKFFAGGGEIGSNISVRDLTKNVVNNFNIKDQLREVFAELPPQVVILEDVAKGLTGLTQTEIRANQ